jgi:hypothetical protein
MEIINNGPVTPHRLHALVRLVVHLGNPTKDDLFNLLQPAGLIKNQEVANNVYQAAVAHDLVIEQGDSRVLLHDSLNPTEIVPVKGFRVHMRKQLLGITDENTDNYLLNLFTAWYAVQDERALTTSKRELVNAFNRDLFPTSGRSDVDEGRAFNTTKYNAWLRWATFLGYGWVIRLGSSDTLAPDAYGRLVPLIPRLLDEKADAVPFRDFATSLAGDCPELDRGSLFQRCWQASRSAEHRGNQLSLMLSTGLRVLDREGIIRLQYESDAEDVWHLYPAEADPLPRVTHIGLGRNAQ